MVVFIFIAIFFVSLFANILLIRVSMQQKKVINDYEKFIRSTGFDNKVDNLLKRMWHPKN